MGTRKKLINVIYSPYLSDNMRYSYMTTISENDLDFISEYAVSCGFLLKIMPYAKESIDDYLVVEIKKYKE